MRAMTLPAALLWFALVAGPEPAMPQDANSQPTDKNQNLARTLSELRDWVRLGDTVYVTDFEGRQLKGEIEKVSSEGLKLRRAGLTSPLSFSESDLRGSSSSTTIPSGMGH